MGLSVGNRLQFTDADAAAPLLAQIRSQTRTTPARLGPMFSGSVPAGASLNAYDLAHRTLLGRVSSDVRLHIAAGKLAPEQRLAKDPVNVMNDTNQDGTTAAAKQLLLRAKHW